MRCLTPFVIIAVLAVAGATGFNFIQLNRMKAEVAQMKSTVETVSIQPLGESGVASQLKSAKEHASMARQMLSRGKITQAKRELGRSIELMENVSSVAEKAKNGSNDGIGIAWKTMQAELDRALKEISRQVQEGRSGGNGKKFGE